MKNLVVLGIESSCDDTSVAIIQGRKILSNITANQNVHQKFGGVVPEMASRAHQQNIVPTLQQAILQANIDKKDISAIAFTKGPGLLGSLLVGASFAKSLAMALEIPLIEVHHMQAHILAHFIDDDTMQKPNFPFLCLTVSGGHTQIVRVNDYFEMKIIGETKDDAAGEAFDKIGKMLGLEYPAGREIDELAQQGNPKAFQFPIPKVDNFGFSFSGIKTSVLYFLQKKINKNPDFIKNNINDLCASVQFTIIKSLINKLQKASEELSIKEVAISGGVSANSALRKALKDNEQKGIWEAYIPKFEYTTDNAAMIALVGSLKFERNQFTDLSASATARYSF